MEIILNRLNINIRSSFLKMRNIVFVLLMCLTVIQQFPTIMNFYYADYRTLMYILFISFTIFSIFSIRKYLSNLLIKLFIIGIVTTLALYGVSHILGIRVVTGFPVFQYDVIELLVPFGILVCSISTNFNKKSLHIFLLIYILLTLIMGLRTLYYYGDGFIISRDVYIIRYKNQIGPLLGISAIIVGLSIFDRRFLNVKYLGIFTKIIIFALLMGCIITMRNRAGALAIAITISLYLIFDKKIFTTRKNLLVALLVASLFALLYFSGPLKSIVDFVFTSFTQNYDIDDLESISAGRWSVYLKAIDFIKQYPVFGSLGGANFIADTSIHHYLLKKWVTYGILLSLPLTFLYLYLYLFVFKNIFNNKIDKSHTIVCWILFFSLIVSNFEHNFPYGPGVSQAMIWILFAQFIKANSNTSKTNIAFTNSVN
jgi:hypothetical protein